MAHHLPYSPFRPPYHNGELCHFYYGQPPSGSAPAMPHDAGLPPHSFQYLPPYVDAVLPWPVSQSADTAGAAAPGHAWYSMPTTYYGTPALSSVGPAFADPGRVNGPPQWPQEAKAGSSDDPQDYTLYPESQDVSVASPHLSRQTPLRASPPGSAHLSQASPAEAPWPAPAPTPAGLSDGFPASVMTSPSVEALLSTVQDWPSYAYIQDRLPDLLRLKEKVFPGKALTYEMLQNLVVMSAWVYGATYENIIKWRRPFFRDLNAAAAAVRLRRLALVNDQVEAALDIGKRVRRNPSDTRSVELPRWSWEAQEGWPNVEGN